jgi:hypothetical protein
MGISGEESKCQPSNNVLAELQQLTHLPDPDLKEIVSLTSDKRHLSVNKFSLTKQVN